MAEHRGIVGLSRAPWRVRSEISRLAPGEKGPWTPTLILGESGTGKELVARALFDAYDRWRAPTAARQKGTGFHAIAAAWFTPQLLQSQLFGHERYAFTGADQKKVGVLKAYENGAVLIDDFDAAAAQRDVQVALLRVMATPRGEPADIHPLGSTEPVQTRAWLLFATNVPIEKLLRKKQVREDFIYRFEDRILNVPPLRERRADVPALVRRFWDELWKDTECPRPLSPLFVRAVCLQPTRWEGNVRALRAMLLLAVSMAKHPSHRTHGMQRIAAEIFSRGREFKHWVGIVASPVFVEPAGDPRVRQVLALDRDSACHGMPPGQVTPAGSERHARAECLTAQGCEKLDRAAAPGPRSRNDRGDMVRRAVRLARIVCYLHAGIGPPPAPGDPPGGAAGIDRRTAMELGGTSDNTARADLKLLQGQGMLKKEKRGTAEVFVVPPDSPDWQRPPLAEFANGEGGIRTRDGV